MLAAALASVELPCCWGGVVLSRTGRENITVHMLLKQHKVGKAHHQILVGWFLFSFFFSDSLKAFLVLTIGEHDLPCHPEQNDLEK